MYDPARCTRLVADGSQCKNAGDCMPVIMCPASPGGPTAQGLLPLPTCNDCRVTTELSGLLTDTGWEQICEALAAGGWSRPPRELAFLSWMPMKLETPSPASEGAPDEQAPPGD